MPDDMSFLDANQFPDRPDHPDFWRLSKIVLANDAAAREDHTPIPEIVGQYIDYPSIEYFAMSRMGQLITQMGLPPALIPVLASTWFDAFTTGVQFAKEAKQDVLLDLLRTALPYLDDHQDEGPPGEGWKSTELLLLVTTIEATLGAT